MTPEKEKEGEVEGHGEPEEVRKKVKGLVEMDRQGGHRGQKVKEASEMAAQVDYA